MPVLSFCQIASEYTSSKRFCASTTGRIELSAFASPLSSGSRGSTIGSGKASIASACLETMTLCSHPLFERKPPSPSELSLLSSALLRSFHQFSAATTRLSRLAFPVL